MARAAYESSGVWSTGPRPLLGGPPMSFMIAPQIRTKGSWCSRGLTQAPYCFFTVFPATRIHVHEEMTEPPPHPRKG